MNLIITLIIGGIVGWLASIAMKTNAQMGIIANVLVGVGGALLGGRVAGRWASGAAASCTSWWRSAARCC